MKIWKENILSRSLVFQRNRKVSVVAVYLVREGGNIVSYSWRIWSGLDSVGCWEELEFCFSFDGKYLEGIYVILVVVWSMDRQRMVMSRVKINLESYCFYLGKRY